jgi:tetratricopeptide (TPR) repeat protein
LGNWQPLLKGQIYAQMGILCVSTGNEEKGLAYLEKSSTRFADAQMFLAAAHSKRGNHDKALSVLQTCEAFNKKHILLHNLHAYLLEKQGKRTEAIAVLNKLLKSEKSNETTKDNLLRLQNDKKLNMKRFGMPWYALQLEKPPASMGQQRAARPGFRQKGKRR